VQSLLFDDALSIGNAAHKVRSRQDTFRAAALVLALPNPSDVCENRGANRGDGDPIGPEQLRLQMWGRIAGKLK
jgi:hypothetical protein